MNTPCNIGLAPLAGYTNYPFRKITYDHGACFAYTEMISARSVFEKPELVEKMLPREDEPFTGIQIFGKELEWLKRAAEKLQTKGAFIDINAGCPVKKVIKKGMGGALLQDLERLFLIVKELKYVLKVPLTVKTRLGWDKNEVEKIYYGLVEAGADFVVIHTRTVKQGFSGKSDWKALSVIKEKPILLYVSGDLFKPENVKEALEISGADGVVIARGAIGNPWIFEETKDFFENGFYDKPSLSEKLNEMLRHLRMNVEYFGEKKGVVEFRKIVSGYTKGLPNARDFRRKFMKTTTYEEVLKLVKEFY